MPSEKEININLLEKLEIVENALHLAKKENAVETIGYLENKKQWLEKMLYQKPSLTDSNN